MKLKHELWEGNGGQELTFCLAGRYGDEARKLLSPDAKLIWTVEAGSHFEETKCPTCFSLSSGLARLNMRRYIIT
jgi:hypothetical protein